MPHCPLCNIGPRSAATVARCVRSKPEALARLVGSWAYPRGLGLATATTLTAFFPHLEQRIGNASSFSVTFQPTRRASASGSISRYWMDE